ncbi:UDP-glucose:glycoprotein glucosyltransferase [Trypanosoma cruzi cruzi]|nr:UDP-glucose:glycoprotein glucosyltransferase [Trypanosoma cruzi cruzi]
MELGPRDCSKSMNQPHHRPRNIAYCTDWGRGRGRFAATLTILLLWSVSLILLEAPTVEGKGVHVTLLAPWTETPLLQEGCEMVAARGAHFVGFYQCMQDVWKRVQAMNSSDGAAKLTQKSQYDILLDMMEQANWPPTQVKLAKMRLAARLYSPVVEAHWQLARKAKQLIGGCSTEGGPFVLTAGKVICSEDLLEETLSAPAPVNETQDGHEDEAFSLFAEIDQLHPNAKGSRVVILYGVVGEEQTMQLLQVLERHLHAVRLAFRHLPISGRMWEHPLHVQGYAVTVDLKNVEYKVIDEKDKNDAGTDANDANTVEETESIGSVGGFNLTLLTQRYPQLKPQLNAFASHLVDMIDRDEVKVDFQMWETQYMGIAAAQYVMDAENEKRLNVLMNLLTKFPLHASKLSKMGATVKAKMNKKMHEELMEFASVVRSGTSPVFLNGRNLAAEKLNLFSFLQKLDEEEQLLEGVQRVFTSYRLPSANHDGFFSAKTDALNQAMVSVRRSVHRYIASNGLEDGEPVPRIWLPQRSVLWLNNIQRDVNYVYMPAALEAILHLNINGVPVIPRKNLIHAVCVVDPTTVAGLQNIFTILKLEESKQPVRLGIVFADNKWSPELSVFTRGNDFITDKSLSGVTVIIAATVWELLKGEEHPQDVLEFLSEVVQARSTRGNLEEDEIKVISSNILTLAGKTTLDNILTDASFVEYYQDTQIKLREMKLDASPFTLLNGKMFQGNMLHALRQNFMEELHYVRGLVQSDALTERDDDDFYESILRLSGARERYNEAFYSEKFYADWTSKPVLDFLLHRPFLLPTIRSKKTPLVSSVLTIQSPMGEAALEALVKTIRNLLQCEDETQKCVNVRFTYVVCDVAKESKRRTMAGDLERLIVRRKGGDDGKQQVQWVYDFLQKIAAQNNTRQLMDPDLYEGLVAEVNFSPEVKKLLDASDEGLDAQLQVQRGIVNGFCAQLEADSLSTSSLSANGAAAGREKGNKEGAVYYYVNGRRFVYDDSFLEEDFRTAEEMEMLLAGAVSEALSKVEFTTMSSELEPSDLESHFYASKVAALSEVLRRDAARGSPMQEENHLPSTSGLTSFVVKPANGDTVPRHTLTVVIDPVAQQSQFLISLCDYVTRSPLGISCTVHMGATEHVSKLMRNFYQFVSEMELRFDAVGRVVPPAAVFHRLPSKHLLTLGIEEPESWTVFSLDAKYDLDNILLDKLPSSSQYLHAVYRINSILLTGSARDAEQPNPSRGLPLLIRSTKTNPEAGVTRDTLVMAIMGYFQLQSSPGVWYLTVQPGDIAKIFYISQVDDIPVNDGANKNHHGRFNYTAGQNIPVVVSSFTGKFLMLGVSKTPGHEEVSIEDVNEASALHVDWPPKGPIKSKPDRPTLNIFSVASGHLYERFLRMMIHSVMRTSFDVHGANTTRIKFWLIENFLSPQFKTLVPLLAKHYGFDVGFVTYRWPWWLHKQTEKQRTIWAYKVLFLDVLFPLDVDRVIFVDADQTVLADLHELYNMDIGNAPTAYTPFCRKHPNPATKNFRFWDHGYWLEHLHGKPYHISAIYLVDLRRLRAIAGGDKYRLVYSRLSSDPNSLANLDQDLPNFIQDQVPIYSLPEEWLWCETWCGAESKARAKTIDLCNNPLTKMPKLDNARLIIPGWEETDTELEALSEKLLQQQKQQMS